MGRAPCCDKTKVKTGPWSPSEDLRLINFIHNHGHTNWRALPKLAGLLRCGKSCRLRWVNYLRPDVKRGNFTPEEENTIIQLHNSFGNKWSKIASRLPGRTDNEIKNVWNTHLKKRAINCDDELAKHTKIVLDMNSASSSSSTSSSSITTTGDDKADTLRPASSHNSTLSDEVATDHEIGDLDDQFDDEFWEMLESLDPVQSNITVEDQINVEEKSDVDFGKWLRFMENELGLNSTDVDLRLDSDPQITSPFHHSLAS